MAELMASGVELMLVGMGIVYLFLAMLVLAINAMSAVVQRFFPEPQTPPATLTTTTTGGGVDKSTVAVIAAAVHQYRSQQK